jgi:hypothetical protein
VKSDSRGSSGLDASFEVPNERWLQREGFQSGLDAGRPDGRIARHSILTCLREPGKRIEAALFAHGHASEG